VHVIGDSCVTTQPKAGHIANQEAKVCADALARIFSGGQPDPSPFTNSACYSTISRTEATWLNAVFQFDAARKSIVAVPKSLAASQSWTADNFKDMGQWFDALMADTFALSSARRRMSRKAEPGGLTGGSVTAPEPSNRQSARSGDR
jgi:hypothetical protein